jgi:hypothetical protein
MSVRFNDLSQELQGLLSAMIPALSVLNADGVPEASGFIYEFTDNFTTVQQLTDQLNSLTHKRG